MADPASPAASWRDRLFGGFRRTSDKLGDNIAGLFTKAALDEQTLDEIEEALIVTDLGPAMAARIRERLAEGRYNRTLTEEYLREILAEEIEAVLKPVAKPLSGYDYVAESCAIVCLRCAWCGWCGYLGAGCRWSNRNRREYAWPRELHERPLPLILL
jgi:signal recognition particle GTPase